MGSLLESDINDGLANALYAFIRDFEYFRLSSNLDTLHSLQIHLTSCYNEEKKIHRNAKNKKI